MVDKQRRQHLTHRLTAPDALNKTDTVNLVTLVATWSSETLSSVLSQLATDLLTCAGCLYFQPPSGTPPSSCPPILPFWRQNWRRYRRRCCNLSWSLLGLFRHRRSASWLYEKRPTNVLRRFDGTSGGGSFRCPRSRDGGTWSDKEDLGLRRVPVKEIARVRWGSGTGLADFDVESFSRPVSFDSVLSTSTMRRLPPPVPPLHRPLSCLTEMTLLCSSSMISSVSAGSINNVQMNGWTTSNKACIQNKNIN